MLKQNNDFQIGLMRGGKFLAEESPEFLLGKYHCESLEDVFLKLSVMQNMGKRRRSSIIQEVSEQVAVPAISVSQSANFIVITQMYAERRNHFKISKLKFSFLLRNG